MPSRCRISSHSGRYGGAILHCKTVKIIDQALLRPMELRYAINSLGPVSVRTGLLADNRRYNVSCVDVSRHLGALQVFPLKIYDQD